MKKKIFFLIAVCLLAACSGKEINENDPEALYKDAEEDIQDKRYAMAMDKLKLVKNKFPYSQHSVSAQLRIADVHFAEEQFGDAATAYEVFRDLHPKHAKSDYVIFQLGQSYFNQLPSTEDRDLTPATKAIEAYEELFKLYPTSPNVDEARKNKSKARQMLADKERYVAKFYMKRGAYESAAQRYEKAIQLYPETDGVERMWWDWAESSRKVFKASETKDLKKRWLEKTTSVYQNYLKKYPEGKYVQNSQDRLKNLESDIEMEIPDSESENGRE